MTENELEALKRKADLMGIDYKGNIGIETLRAKINAKLDDKPDPTVSNDNDGQPAKSARLTAAEELAAERSKQMKEQLALKRVRITCLNPAKAQWRGEIMTFANPIIGTVRRMIPFGDAGGENGTHVEVCLLNFIKERQYNRVHTTKGKNGQMHVHQKLVREFAVEELEPLTEKELAQLAAAQAAAGGVDDN